MIHLFIFMAINGILRSFPKHQCSKMSKYFLCYSSNLNFCFHGVSQEKKKCHHSSDLSSYRQVTASEYFFPKPFIDILPSAYLWCISYLLDSLFLIILKGWSYLYWCIFIVSSKVGCCSCWHYFALSTLYLIISPIFNVPIDFDYVWNKA